MKRGIQSGFTIVELLVVIVVIGILAAITIVSYTGIVKKATIASLNSSLDGASKQLKLDQAVDSNNQYPPSTGAANGGKGLTSCAGSTTCQYSTNNSLNPPTYCLTETTNNLSYYTASNSVPTIGGCPGDIVSGSPSILNPSFESDTTGNLSYPLQWNQYGMVGNVYEGVASDYSSHGTKSFKISQSSADMDGGVWARISGLTIGQNVSVSAWIKSGAGVANATLDLCTSQHGLTGNQNANANQGQNANGRFTATLNNVDQTAVDVFIGQGSWGL